MIEEDFEDLKLLFRDLLYVEEQIEFNEYADDSVLVGCDCGCGGDCVDWERAKREYHALTAEKADLEAKIKAMLRGGDYALPARNPSGRV